MRTAIFSFGNITYPDEICFAFNPTYVKITGFNKSSVDIRISAAVDMDVTSYTLTYAAYGGMVTANIARILQLFFDSYTITEKRSVDVNAQLIVDGSVVFGFQTVAIWGNIAPGETFNGKRTVRWFDNWPQRVSVFTGGMIQDLDIRNDQYMAVSPFDYTFDFTFRAGAIANISFIHDESRDGLFLRWIDRHGLLQYWLFDKGVREVRNNKGGAEMTMNYADRQGNSFRNIKRQQYFFGEVSQELCAPNVTEEEYTMLEGILTSPVIDLYHPSTIVGWEPVRIAKGTIKRSMDVLQDFKFEIELPNVNAQSL